MFINILHLPSPLEWCVWWVLWTVATRGSWEWRKSASICCGLTSGGLEFCQGRISPFVVPQCCLSGEECSCHSQVAAGLFPSRLMCLLFSVLSICGGWEGGDWQEWAPIACTFHACGAQAPGHCVCGYRRLYHVLRDQKQAAVCG